MYRAGPALIIWKITYSVVLGYASITSSERVQQQLTASSGLCHWRPKICVTQSTLKEFIVQSYATQ
jgi:hypothetical protein